MTPIHARARGLFLAHLALLPACAGTVTAPDPPDEPAADASTDAPVTVVGRPCATDADCGDEARCQTNVPGGYCVLDCSGGIPCPDGTLCSPMPLSRVGGVCMLACAATAECRDGYACGVVELFPGDPNAPKSPGPVCWVPPPP